MIISQSLYYDQYSRSKIEQDASGKAVKNNYNAQGYLERITNAENESQQYYKINTTDHRGNITKDTKAANLVTDYYFDDDRGFMTDIINNSLTTNLRYNYSYDKLGNLLKRDEIRDVNNNIGVGECFYYDDLNRLTETRRYDIFGTDCTQDPRPATPNITSISYNGKGNITNKDGQTYEYLNASQSEIGSSPHQVTQKGSSQIYTYDANGNNTKMTSFVTKNGSFQNRNIVYNTFNKVERLWTGNDTNNPIAEANYKYDTTRQKYARIDEENGEIKVTYFIGNVEIENNAGVAKYKRQLGNYAILTETDGTTTEAYLFTDHLGSVDTISDASGTILQRMSFSAWGERRLPTNWEDMALPTVRQQMDGFTNRGYTGHEMVDAFGIINMGGRLYDAALGRVLQADPFVQDPTNTQSFNRYTYVFNNPLSYTDPSGYFSLRQALGIVVGLVLSIFNPFALGVFWSAFVAGFASSFIITGNLKTALISGLIAGSIAFVGDKIIPKKVANKVDSKTVNKKLDPGASLDTTTANRQFTEIPAPDIPDATGEAFNKAIEKVGQNAPSTVSKGISSVGDKVALDNITVTYSPQALTGFVHTHAVFNALSTGLSSQLAREWAKNFLFDRDLLNGIDMYNQMNAAIDKFESTNRVFGELKDGGIYSSAIFGTLFGGAAIPVIAESAAVTGAAIRDDLVKLGELTKSGLSNASILFKEIGVGGRIAIAVFFADGEAYALAVPAVRTTIIESLKHGFVGNIRQQLTQSLIRQGMKRELINKILRSLPN